MKTTFSLIVIVLYVLNSNAQSSKKNAVHLNDTTKLIYRRHDSNKMLELLGNGTYTLYRKTIPNSHFVIEKCAYDSKGRWQPLAKNVLQLTSEDYYLKQLGFKYELLKEKKWSEDSLYIKIILPEDFVYFRTKAVNFVFYFNSNISKVLITDSTFIKLKKSKHLYPFPTNEISFSIEAKVGGTTMYKSRVSFNIFDENMNTTESNFLTISLPNFDLCFFEFEPINHELIYEKNANELIWRGASWIKQ